MSSLNHLSIVQQRRAVSKHCMFSGKMFAEHTFINMAAGPRGPISGEISKAIKDGTWPEDSRRPWPNAQFKNLVLGEMLVFDWQLD